MRACVASRTTTTTRHQQTKEALVTHDLLVGRIMGWGRGISSLLFKIIFGLF